ncbi:MAG: co-chaperone YbbN [Acidimicrobiales bacterium]|nr:MAG: co-chaperone YbbN [Acidimicrobiales bacterium]
MTAIDVTDHTFHAEVVERSRTTPVVVDFWAEWCQPCRMLGPILEKVVADTGGKVVLAKVNVDQNPQTPAQFGVRGIPAVFALKNATVVDGFVGAQGEQFVRNFVAKLLPTAEEEEVERLIAAGDEESLRKALELDPDNARAVEALAELLVAKGEKDEALQLLAKVPENANTRRIAALARTGGAVEDVEQRLRDLLDRVKQDEDARREFLDLLEVLGPDDPRTAAYRRELASRLY